MPTEEYDGVDVHDYVDKSMAIQGEEAHEQLSITKLLKPFL